MTKKQAVALAGDLHSIAQSMYSCYCNDRQPNRAQAMYDLMQKGERLARLLQEEPL